MTNSLLRNVKRWKRSRYTVKETENHDFHTEHHPVHIGLIGRTIADAQAPLITTTRHSPQSRPVDGVLLRKKQQVHGCLGRVSALASATLLSTPRLAAVAHPRPRVAGRFALPLGRRRRRYLGAGPPLHKALACTGYIW